MGYAYSVKCNNCAYDEEFFLGFGTASLGISVLFYCTACKTLEDITEPFETDGDSRCGSCSTPMQRIGSEHVQFKRPRKCNCGGYFSISWSGLWD